MKKSKFQQYFHCFIVYILGLYAFWFSLQQNIETILMMMMMMMMMMNCFYGTVDRRKAFSLISSRGNCERSSPSRISDIVNLQANLPHREFQNGCPKVRRLLEGSAYLQPCDYQRKYGVSVSIYHCEKICPLVFTVDTDVFL